jgi:hypothetical protein
MRHQPRPKGARPLLGKFEHAINTSMGLLLNLRRHMNFSDALFKALQHSVQPIHGHPGTLRAAFAGGALAGSRRFDELFARSQLSHAVK